MIAGEVWKFLLIAGVNGEKWRGKGFDVRRNLEKVEQVRGTVGGERYRHVVSSGANFSRIFFPVWPAVRTDVFAFKLRSKISRS